GTIEKGDRSCWNRGARRGRDGGRERNGSTCDTAGGRGCKNSGGIHGRRDCRDYEGKRSRGTGRVVGVSRILSGDAMRADGQRTGGIGSCPRSKGLRCESGGTVVEDDGAGGSAGTGGRCNGCGKGYACAYRS